MKNHQSLSLPIYIPEELRYFLRQLVQWKMLLGFLMLPIETVVVLLSARVVFEWIR